MKDKPIKTKELIEILKALDPGLPIAVKAAFGDRLRIAGVRRSTGPGDHSETENLIIVVP